MTSKLWEVRTALLTIFTAAVDPVEVFDGPRHISTLPEAFLLVGTDGGDEGTNEGGDDGSQAEQVPSQMGNDWRDEAGLVTCGAWAWNGKTDLAPLRETAEGIVDLCETALLADRSLGGVLTPQDRLAEFGGLRIRERQTPQGAQVRASFTVAYRALIT